MTDQSEPQVEEPNEEQPIIRLKRRDNRKGTPVKHDGPKLVINTRKVKPVNMEEFKARVNADIKAGKYRDKKPNHWFPEMRVIAEESKMESIKRLVERLEPIPEKLRRTPMPVKDVVPLMRDLAQSNHLTMDLRVKVSDLIEQIEKQYVPICDVILVVHWCLDELRR